MIIRDKVRQDIDLLPEGTVVGPADFDIPLRYRATLVKALNQYESAGILKRLSKGRYYKPRKSRFGELPPSESEIIREFLERKGDVIGYITGTRAFARLALTTQISSAILIGSNIPRRPVVRGQYKISFLYQPNPIGKDDVPLLVILDALRLIKEIPGATPDEAIRQTAVWINLLSAVEQKQLLDLSKAYQPYVRAQVGAIYDFLEVPTSDLQNTINPGSRYRLGITSSALPTARNWNIL